MARRGSTQCGMPAPTLVHFEQQIDAELLQAKDDDGAAATAAAAAAECRGVADGQEDGSQLEVTATSDGHRKPVIEVDWMSLDEMVCLIYGVHGVTVDTIRARWKMFVVICGKLFRTLDTDICQNRSNFTAKDMFAYFYCDTVYSLLRIIAASKQ